jgi:hypothetical protein
VARTYVIFAFKPLASKAATASCSVFPMTVGMKTRLSMKLGSLVDYIPRQDARA